ncbi:MAG: DUF2750 domain-containing protein [Cellvibrio sp.]
MTDQIEPLSDDLDENFDRFIVEALEQGCVWVLQAGEGYAVCGSENHDDMDVMPFWSQREFAEIHCKDDWADYQPLAVDVQEFLDDWLPGMHDDLILAGINWDADLIGEEIEPLDLLEEFDQEMPE